ncbi:hypothetical protein CQW23_12269 [Capsicum baccatum]|uniref:Uncharacterized protein n=1 Tax=Capsicum baccatum TaxID=33114 RepID=A0A2G2WS94_CAPBA|nr:hypothetical protein CQW23_12269 [Capsicum baccatum]
MLFVPLSELELLILGICINPICALPTGGTGNNTLHAESFFGRLEEGFVQCMPNTRSSGQLLLPINLEPHRIGRIEAQQKEQDRLASLASAQVHQQNIYNPGRATNPNNENLGDDELLNPRRDAEMATLANRRDRQARFKPERRAIPFDDDDDDLDGAGATGTIIPPLLAPGAKFNIMSTMIQLLQLKGLFGGLAGDDPNMHLINFISTCKSFDNPGVEQNAI